MGLRNKAGQGRVLPHIHISIHSTGEGHVVLQSIMRHNIRDVKKFSLICMDVHDSYDKN